MQETPSSSTLGSSLRYRAKESESEKAVPPDPSTRLPCMLACVRPRAWIYLVINTRGHWRYGVKGAKKNLANLAEWGYGRKVGNACRDAAI